MLQRELYPKIDLYSGTHEGKLKFEFIVKTGGNPGIINLQYEGVNSIKLKNGELEIKTSLNQIIEEAPYAYQVIDGKEVEVPCRYLLKKDQVSFDFPNGYDPNYELVIDPTLIFSTYSGSRADNFGYTATYDSKGYLYSGSTAFGAQNNYPTTSGAYMQFFQGGFGSNGGADIAISKYDTNGSKFIYSTYLGGLGNEMPHSLVVNSRDELYVMGTTGSRNFPTTSNAPQRTLKNPSSSNAHSIFGFGINYNEGCDLFAFKFSPDGRQSLGGTYIGGSRNDGLSDTARVPNMTLRYNYADEVRGEIDIDNNDDVLIGSCTKSSDFPMSGNGFDKSFNGGMQDGVVIKLSNNLDTIKWSSFLGGSGLDAIYSLAVDKNNDIYLAGGTNSFDTTQFPTGSHPDHMLNFGGRAEGFITHVKSDGSQIINSTYYGRRQYDQIYFVELGRKGQVFVLGQTEDDANFFIKSATYNKGREGVFISKLSAKLDTTFWSTTIGRGGRTTGLARPQLSPTAFLVDVCNAIYFSGWGGTTNTNTNFVNNRADVCTGLDTTSDAYQKTTDGNDFYVCAIKDDVSGLIYGSYLGGTSSGEHVDGGTSRFDKKGVIYQSVCAGCGGNSDWPIYPRNNVVSNVNRASNCNNAVFKMAFAPPGVIAEFQIPKRICQRDSIPLQNLSKEMNAPQYIWYFGNGDTSHKKSPKVFYDSIGLYSITLVIIDSTSCNYSDTITKQVIVQSPNPTQRLTGDTICLGDTLILGDYMSTSFEFIWRPGINMQDSTYMRPFAWPQKTTDYTLLVNTGVCRDTFRQFVQVDSLIKANIVPADSVCEPDTINLKHNSTLLQNSGLFWNISSIGIVNDPSPNIPVNQNGSYSYTLYVYDSLSCNKIDSVQGVFEVYSDTSFQLPRSLLCNGETKSIGIGNNPNYQYMWSPTDGLSDSTVSNPVVSAKSDKNYQVLIDRGVCVDTGYQEVWVDSIALQTVGDTDICTTGPTIILSANSFGLGNFFHWSSNPGFTDTINTSGDSTALVTPPFFENWYFAKTSSRRGCEEIDSALVRVHEFGILVDSNQSICFGDTLQLKIVSLVPNDSLNVLWKPYKDIIGPNDTSHILVNPKQDQWYIVDAENSLKCLTHDSALVQVSKLNYGDGTANTNRDTILKNQNALLSSTPSGFAYEWSPAYELSSTTSQNTIASPDTSTTYTVKIYDPDDASCFTTRQVRVQVDEVYCERPWLYIPNSFSPNGDGKNEVLYFRGKYIGELDFKLYNRWGELVFETQDTQIGWDGIYKGQEAQADVYVYTVKAVCLDGQVFEEKGDITLIR
jgi:gliding motility-associated-like protein